MKPTYLLLGLVSSIALAEDYPWFEADWISDVATTVDANPKVKTLDPDTRKSFESLFGLTRWHVSNGVLTVSHPKSESLSNPYFLRPVDSKTFEAIIINDEFETIFTVKKTEQGFCAELHPSWVPEYHTWTDPDFIECFVPDDA